MSWKDRSLVSGASPPAPTISQPCTRSCGPRKVWRPLPSSCFCRQHAWSCQAKVPHCPGWSPSPASVFFLPSSLSVHLSSLLLSFCCDLFQWWKLCHLAVMLLFFTLSFLRATNPFKKNQRVRRAGWDLQEHFVKLGDLTVREGREVITEPKCRHS